MTLRWLLDVLVVTSLVGCAGAGLQPAMEARPTAPSCTAPSVTTTSGAFCGLADSGAAGGRRYLGIPYAESTADSARWTDARPFAPRPGVGRATRFGLACPQPALGGRIEQSEDCLSVNAWVPGGTPPERGWPVMVFIHGGAFFLGASSAGVYDGGRLAAKGPVVVASFNYRLGALGSLAGIDGLAGNFGFRDQQLALAWVQANIARFAGDPARVTLFGESAGAMSIGLHLNSPDSRGLFRAAIMQSNPYGIPYKGMADARAYAQTLRRLVGCDSGGLACMRSVPIATLLEHQQSTLFKVDGLLHGFSGELVWAPVVDGTTVPEQANAAAAAVPMLIGTNTDEGELFVIGFEIALPFTAREIPALEYDAALRLLFSQEIVAAIAARPRYASKPGDNSQVLAGLLTDYLFTCASRRVMNDATAPVHAYQFAHPASYDLWPGLAACAPGTGRTCHGWEMPFVFGNPVTVRIDALPPATSARFAPRDEAVAETMMGYWTRFATSLDPNHAGSPPWPRYSRDAPDRLVIGTTVAPARDLGAQCEFWDSVGYDQPGLHQRLAPPAPASR